MDNNLLTLSSSPSLSLSLSLIEKQNEMKKSLDFQNTILEKDIKYIAGVDTAPNGKSVIVILEYPSMQEVYSNYIFEEFTIPYISGFLGFREVPIFQKLLDILKKDHPEYYPDLIMVDGNGTLHNNKFGSACHLGVLSRIPTIGVSKTLYNMDNLNISNYKNIGNKYPEYIDMIVNGEILGRALWNCKSATNCIFISPGNMITLDVATQIILNTSIYRIPEPIRKADIISKEK